MTSRQRRGPAFLFDLDGTLVDSVYQHVLAWREALEQGGIELAVWRIHRRIGMSGGLFLDGLARETGRRLTPEDVARIQKAHAVAFKRQVSQVRPLPGAADLLAYLSQAGVAWAGARCGSPVRRVRSRRAGARGRLPGLSRPRRSVAPLGRARRAALGGMNPAGLRRSELPLLSAVPGGLTDRRRQKRRRSLVGQPGSTPALPPAWGAGRGGRCARPSRRPPAPGPPRSGCRPR